MYWTREVRLAAACASVGYFGLLAHAGAFGALAVGGPVEGSGIFTTSFVNNRATEDAARTAARAACANNKGAPEAVRSTCAVVTTFRNQCLAVAGRSWMVAADEQAARDEASAKCRGATDANVREAICRTVNSVCDTSPKSRTSRGKGK